MVAGFFVGGQRGGSIRRGFHFAFVHPFACVRGMSFPTDTIAALATPTGTSAIALVRVSGPDAPALTEAIFQETPLPRFARHADYCDVSGRIVDDVLFTYFAGPGSFTGEDSLEISCHGNPLIAKKILEDLLVRGCRSAEAGEFSKRAFLNGRMSLNQAEAIMDLIHARSERALMVANQQLRGSLERRMEELVALLINVLANIEAYIDFPDEDLPPEDRESVLTGLNTLLAGTRQLLATGRYGELLRDGIRTVIIGAPNAGKSSLLNRLLGRERALVSSEPGTTRDYLEERIIIGDHWLRLIDTAGLNPEPGRLERQGIEKAIEQASSADIFLWVIDSQQAGRPALPAELKSRLNRENALLVYNKIDLGEVPEMKRDALDLPFVRVSALDGTGFDHLEQALTVLAGSFQVTIGEDLIAINVRHTQALQLARQCLEAAIEKLKQSIYSELIASDLRGALDAFGQISGKVDNEKMLDRLFATFCIGK